MTNLKQYGVAANTYMADFDDSMPAYGWRVRDAVNAGYNPADNIEATMNQLHHIIVTNMGWQKNSVQRWDNRLPQRRYTHAVMLDYMDNQFPAEIAASPGDKQQLRWQKDLYMEVEPIPNSGGNGAWNRLVPFASSYQAVPASFSPDRFPTFYPATSSHNLFFVPDGFRPGPRRNSEVIFPAQKVYFFSYYDYHQASEPIYYAYPDARSTMLMFDGSASRRLTSDANLGFRPDNPRAKPLMVYKPDLKWEPRTRKGSVTEPVFGYYRWTAGGLQGIDYGGEDINVEDW